MMERRIITCAVIAGQAEIFSLWEPRNRLGNHPGRSGKVRHAHVNQRWLGGMLTNFKTIRKRIERLLELEQMEEEGTFERLPGS